MPEERFPVKRAFPLVGLRVEARLSAPDSVVVMFLVVTVAVARTWYR
jgi:hypothetical protein